MMTTNAANRFRIVSATTAVAIALAAGCASSRPVPRVPVPAADDPHVATKTYEPLRPLRPPTADEQNASLPAPAYDDEPLVSQAPPEQPAYLDAYAKVGRPRVAVFVNRTVDGKLLPVDERKTIAGVDVTHESTGAVEMESSRSSGSYDPWTGDRSRDASDRFKSNGPARVTEHAEVYLAPGEYDDAQAKSIDYEAIELALTDTLAAGGKVTLVDPTLARQRLSDEEVKELQAGRPQVLREIAEKLDADVLVQVQARPTKSTDGNQVGVRILVEAMNTRGGESLARAFVDVPPPLEKPTINRYTRFLARKTMDELTGAWTQLASSPPPQRGGPMAAPPVSAPATAPAAEAGPTTRTY